MRTYRDSYTALFNKIGQIIEYDSSWRIVSDEGKAYHVASNNKPSTPDNEYGVDLSGKFFEIVTEATDVELPTEPTASRTFEAREVTEDGTEIEGGISIVFVQNVKKGHGTPGTPSYTAPIHTKDSFQPIVIPHPK